MTALEELFAQTKRNVDSVLEQLIPSPSVRPVRLHEAIRWSLFGGGKRIRPTLLFATGRTFGAEDNKLERTAAAIELIHTYSLVHDDLPSMDDDDLRRGRATSHIHFGEATAILAGDVMQTLAFKAIADDRSLPSELRIRLISLIADAAGTPFGMVSGQQLDLDAEGHEITFDELENIHRQKTGALITAAAIAGAIIGGADANEIAAVRQFAERLGLLFQITDDLLDVTRGTEELGKTAGKDAAAAKATYPGHYGVERTRELAREILEDIQVTLSLIDQDTFLLQAVATMVAERTR